MTKTAATTPSGKAPGWKLALRRELRRACIKLQCAFARARRQGFGIFHAK
jgi:hypothetical protein